MDNLILDPQQRALYEVLSGAAARLDAGQPAEALKVLQSRGGFALNNPVGKNILGEVHLQLGDALEALRSFDAAIKLAPNFAEAHANRGAALMDLKRFDEALDAERRALKLRPKFATAQFNRGIALAALKRGEEAIQAFSAAIKERPEYPEALLNRGIALVEAERPVEALTDFNRAQALQPDLLGALLGIASAHRALGQKDKALGAVERALAQSPGDAKALVIKVGLLSSMELYADALPIIDDVVARVPDDYEVYVQRFSILRGLRRFHDALADADAVVRLKPDNSEGHSMRAVALSDLDRMEEALEAMLLAEKLGARSDAYFHVRAVLMTDLGDLNEARASYRKALAMVPDKAVYHHHNGMLLLSMGAFDKGWEEHEWRLRDSQYGYDRRSAAPHWKNEDLTGKRVLVVHEQGSGDNLQFCRFVPELAARGADTSLLVLRPLAGLMRRSFPAVDVTDTLGVRKQFDYQVPIMSLPYLLKKQISDLPGPFPYLFADEARIAKWRERIGSEGFKIGIVWQGNPGYFRDNYRSVPLRTFAALAAIPGVRLISLQAVNGLDQLASLPAGMTVERYGDEIERNPDGFEEIAALSANLDLVLTSDTGAAHLVGSLGRPIWVALRHRPDWRWMYDRADTPWYPNMRLFRQAEHGDWPTLFEEIAAALRERIAASGR